MSADRMPTSRGITRASMTLGVGQFCTKPGLLFAVESGDLAGFRVAVAEAIAAAAPASMLSPDIRAAFEQGREALLGVSGTAILGRSATAADPAKTQAAGLIAIADGATFLAHERLAEEVFGPWSLVVVVKSPAELRAIARRLDGQLTATIHGTPEDLAGAGDLLELLGEKAGRLIVNGFPTGVEVCHAMQPAALQDANPLVIERLVEGIRGRH